LYNQLLNNRIVGFSFEPNSGKLLFKLAKSIKGYDTGNKTMYYINEKDMAQLLTGDPTPSQDNAGDLLKRMGIKYVTDLPFYFEG
jgi:hypothetical protein